MKVILPVAGMGTRLRPHTLTRPKCLLSLAGNTIIGHIIESLKDIEVDEYIFITGYKSKEVEDYINNNYPNIPSRFIIQENPQGLGEAIFLCAPYIENEPTLIILGDTVFEANLPAITQLKNNALCVRQVNDPSRFGVALTDKNKKITKLVEKPESFVSDLALVGIYWVTDSKFLFSELKHIIEDDIRTRGEFQLTDALQNMLLNNKVFSAEPIEHWLDCGKYETMLETNSKLLSNYADEATDPMIIPPCHIHPSAKIKNSTVGPNVSIGENAIVANSKLCNSIIEERCTISNSNLSDSILGKNCTIVGVDGLLNVGDYAEIRT